MSTSSNDEFITIETVVLSGANDLNVGGYFQDSVDYLNALPEHKRKQVLAGMSIQMIKAKKEIKDHNKEVHEGEAKYWETCQEVEDIYNKISYHKACLREMGVDREEKDEGERPESLSWSKMEEIVRLKLENEQLKSRLEVLGLECKRAQDAWHAEGPGDLIIRHKNSKVKEEE